MNGLDDDHAFQWPPYSYVPGGPWPHPIRDPRGHSFGMRSPAVKPIVGDSWNDSQAYTRGVELFNAGYYWEAHEVWEPLWHAHGRCGPTADLIKGLIKLAAAGVKVREGQPHGVQTHARRASELFDQVRREFGPRCLGLDLDEWTIRARQIAETPVFKQVPTDAARVRVFDFQIEPSDDP